MLTLLNSEYLIKEISARVMTYLTLTLNEFREEGRVAYFYCDFRKADSQKPLNVIGSLVAQLCCESGNFPVELVYAFDSKRDNCGRRQRPDFEVLKRALQLFAEENKLILMIDAIDECEGRESLLEFIGILGNEMENISLLITSRNEPDIHDRLLFCERVTLESHLKEMDHDVKSYIDNRLKSDQNLQWLDASVKAEIRSYMKRRSGGM
jgi:hypothetical protein